MERKEKGHRWDHTPNYIFEILIEAGDGAEFAIFDISSVSMLRNSNVMGSTEHGITLVW